MIRVLCRAPQAIEWHGIIRVRLSLSMGGTLEGGEEGIPLIIHPLPCALMVPQAMQHLCSRLWRLGWRQCTHRATCSLFKGSLCRCSISINPSSLVVFHQGM